MTSLFYTPSGLNFEVLLDEEHIWGHLIVKKSHSIRLKFSDSCDFFKSGLASFFNFN